MAFCAINGKFFLEVCLRPSLSCLFFFFPFCLLLSHLALLEHIRG